MEGGDARWDGGEGFCAAAAVDAKDGARSIADEEGAVGTEGEAARDPEIRGHHLIAAVVEHAIDAAFETARYVEPAIRTDRHRRWIDEAMHEWFTRAGGGDFEDRHCRFLPARSAVGHKQAAVGGEGRVIDLMQAGGEQTSD